MPSFLDHLSEKDNMIFSYHNSYVKIFLLFHHDLQWEESVCEKYPHIVHEESSEEISDEKCQDLAADCDFELLEG